jgi:hypothetical protein
MKCEINKHNYSLDESFPILLELTQAAISDPVLKIYLSTLELIQRSLPIFFRGLSQNVIQRNILPVIETILKKTADLKVKVREASFNMLLFLSHQSPIGPEFMVKNIDADLQRMYATIKDTSP